MKFGLPKPDHALRRGAPDDLRPHPRPDHARRGAGRSRTSGAWTATSVEFEDGTRVHADVVVYCTGYKITFPFFDEDFISAHDNRIELYRRVFHPEIPNLFFIGLLQPLGAVMPLAEAQGRWVAEYLKGEYALPSPPEVRAVHRRGPRRDAEALRRLQAAHDPGGLRRLPVRTWRRRSAPASSARATAASRCPSRRWSQRRRRARRPRERRRPPSTRAPPGKREATKAANREAILAAARVVFARARLRRRERARHHPPHRPGDRARSTTTSPTRSRCSARSSTRPPGRSACGVRAARRGATTRRGVRRRRLPRLLRVPGERPRDARAA